MKKLQGFEKRMSAQIITLDKKSKQNNKHYQYKMNFSFQL